MHYEGSKREDTGALLILWVVSAQRGFGTKNLCLISEPSVKKVKISLIDLEGLNINSS